MGQLTHIWIVTKASPSSVMADILFQANLYDLYLQYRGGLDPHNIVAFYDDRASAEKQARDELRKAGAKYEEAGQAGQVRKPVKRSNIGSRLTRG